MFKASIIMAIDNMPQLKEALAQLAQKELLVGFPEDRDVARPTEPKKKQQTNAQLAFINDRGSPALGIPPRPFMREGVESAVDAITEHLTTAAEGALDGNTFAVDRGFEAAGLSAVSGIKSTIVGGLAPPLSPVTLKLRKMRGIKGTKPLIATGQLINAVNYVVRDRK